MLCQSPKISEDGVNSLQLCGIILSVEFHITQCRKSSVVDKLISKEKKTKCDSTSVYYDTNFDKCDFTSVYYDTSLSHFDKLVTL